jgi:hypothetical protein
MQGAAVFFQKWPSSACIYRDLEAQTAKIFAQNLPIFGHFPCTSVRLLAFNPFL